VKRVTICPVLHNDARASWRLSMFHLTSIVLHSSCSFSSSPFFGLCPTTQNNLFNDNHAMPSTKPVVICGLSYQLKLRRTNASLNAGVGKVSWPLSSNRKVWKAIQEAPRARRVSRTLTTGPLIWGICSAMSSASPLLMKMMYLDDSTRRSAK
jgi:hypothetical protein